MSDQLFAGLTEKEWADLESAEGMILMGTPGLVFLGPARFSKERSAPLGEAAIVVGVAVWSLAFSNKGGPVGGRREMRLRACRLGVLVRGRLQRQLGRSWERGAHPAPG